MVTSACDGVFGKVFDGTRSSRPIARYYVLIGMRRAYGRQTRSVGVPVSLRGGERSPTDSVRYARGIANRAGRRGSGGRHGSGRSEAVRSNAAGSRQRHRRLSRADGVNNTVGVNRWQNAFAQC